MKTKVCVVLAITAVGMGLATQRGAAQQSWTPPIGIPAPSFGLTQTARSAPSPWTSETPNYYYVDETHSLASDAYAYGTPARPRRTIPLLLNAGAVVELHGTYTKSHRSPAAFSFQGTEANPVFIRGKSLTERARALQPWTMTGQYFIVENIDFEVDRQTIVAAPIHRGVLRNNGFKGTEAGGGIAVAGSASSTATEVVLYRNKVHDSGNMASTVDEDKTGIIVPAYVSKLWILENEVYRHSGSGIQVIAGNATLQPTVNLIYIGRNRIYQTRQSGVAIKQSTDVIVSENFVSDIIDTSWSPSKCFGFQYAPERVWFLHNHCHNAYFGVYAASDSGQGTGQYSFVIGNTIHGIHAPPPVPTSAWSNAGIMLAGGINRFVLNNTIDDADNGIQSPGGGNLTIVNNIISRVNGNHVFLEHAATATASTIHNNLFEGTVRIKWGSSAVYNVSSFVSTFGKGQNSVNANPLFINPATDIYMVQPVSPAVDRGSSDIVYDWFLGAYGIDIRRDALGGLRPQGPAWDIGAFEMQEGSLRPPTNLRIIK